MAEDTQTNVLRDARGRMLAPLPGKHTITKADASILAHKRWEKYRQAAVKRIVGEAASIDPTVQTPADAFGLVAAKQYTALMDSDKPRIADLEKLGQIMTGKDAQRENADAPANAITAPPEAIMQLVDMLEAKRQADMDKARAIDVETTRSDSD